MSLYSHLNSFNQLQIPWCAASPCSGILNTDLSPCGISRYNLLVLIQVLNQGLPVQSLFCFPEHSLFYTCKHMFSLYSFKHKVTFTQLMIISIKPVSHRGRSEYVFARSAQIPVLVNIAELLVGFPINRNQFVATSA